MNKADNKLKFFIIGAPNSGTTSLWYLIKQHPEVCMSEIKEPRFFTDDNFSKKWDWYKSLFQNCALNNTKAFGEASVNYSETHIWPETPKRIKKAFPEAKIIYLVRDPITRLESCWRQALSSGHWYKKYYTDNLMPLDFKKAVIEYEHFLGTCKYWSHLQEYRKYFDDEKILVIFFEDFIINQKNTVQECFRFLDVDKTYSEKLDYSRKNSGAEKKMLRPFIVNFFNHLPLSNNRKKYFLDFISKKTNSFLLRKLVPQEVNWDTATKEKVVSVLRSEIKSLLSYCGKPLTYYNRYK